MIITQLPEPIKWLPISLHLNPHPASTPPTDPLCVPLYPAGHLTAPWHRTFTLAVVSAWNALPQRAWWQTPPPPVTFSARPSLTAQLKTATSSHDPTLPFVLGILDILPFYLFNLCPSPLRARTQSHQLSCLLMHLSGSEIILLIYLFIVSLPHVLPHVRSPMSFACPVHLCLALFSRCSVILEME